MAHGSHHADHVPGATHEALPHDPEHDIDAKSATYWVIGGTLVTFLSLWIMVPIFMRVLDAERLTKIDKAPNEELDKLRLQESAFLDGGNPKKQPIGTVVDQLRRK
jgi:hypothetical protein